MGTQLHNVALPGVAASPGDAGLMLLSFDISRSAAEQDTGFDFRSGDILLHSYVRVSAGEALTLDVGLLSSESGGDADGILDGVAMSAAGIVGPDIVATDGTDQNYIAAAPKLGALMRSGLLGADGAGTAAALIPRPHVVGTAVSLSTTLSGVASTLEAVGWILFLRLPSLA